MNTYGQLPITAFRLERREEGNFIVVRDTDDTCYAIPQVVFQQVLETLFPESPLKTVSRWDIGTWHDIPSDSPLRGLAGPWTPVTR